MEWIKLKRNVLIVSSFTIWLVFAVYLSIFKDVSVFTLKINYGSDVKNNFITDLTSLIGINAYLVSFFLFIILNESLKVDNHITRGVYKNLGRKSSYNYYASKILFYNFSFIIVFLFQFIFLLSCKGYFQVLEIYTFSFFAGKFLVNTFLLSVQILIFINLFDYKNKFTTLIYGAFYLLSLLFLFGGAEFLPLNSYLNSLSFNLKASKTSIYDFEKFVLPDFYNLLNTLCLSLILYLKNVYQSR